MGIESFDHDLFEDLLDLVGTGRLEEKSMAYPPNAGLVSFSMDVLPPLTN